MGRRFTDAFSASFSVGYEASGDPLVSPLSPTNGNVSVGVGGEYQLTDAVTIGGGVRYTVFGTAQPETSDVARAEFGDNSAVAMGAAGGLQLLRPRAAAGRRNSGRAASPLDWCPGNGWPQQGRAASKGQ